MQSIFKHLLLDKDRREALSGHLHRLNFLPDHDELIDVNSVVRQYNGVTRDTHFRNVLRGVVQSGLHHESSEVKAQTMRKLLQLLRHNQGKLQGLIMTSDQVRFIYNPLPSIMFLFRVYNLDILASILA